MKEFKVIVAAAVAFAAAAWVETCQAYAGNNNFRNLGARPPVDIPCKNLSIRLTGGHAPLLRGLIRGRKRRKTLLKMARRRLENA